MAGRRGIGIYFIEIRMFLISRCDLVSIGTFLTMGYVGIHSTDFYGTSEVLVNCEAVLMLTSRFALAG